MKEMIIIAVLCILTFGSIYFISIRPYSHNDIKDRNFSNKDDMLIKDTYDNYIEQDSEYEKDRFMIWDNGDGTSDLQELIDFLQGRGCAIEKVNKDGIFIDKDKSKDCYLLDVDVDNNSNYNKKLFDLLQDNSHIIEKNLEGVRNEN